MNKPTYLVALVIYVVTEYRWLLLFLLTIVLLCCPAPLNLCPCH